MKSLFICAFVATMLATASELINAQMPAPLRDSHAATSDEWKKAAPTLQAAFDCRQTLQHTDAVKAVFGATNDQLTGEYPLPAPITVYGLKASAISVFEGSDDEGSSYTLQLGGESITRIAKAAKLTKDKKGPRYIRQVKNGGLLEASELQPGHAQLSCIWGARDE